MHKATPRFWDCFGSLPLSAQKVAKKNYKLIKENPRHPSLHFKKVGKFWSVRASINHRALAFKDGELYIWVWIGTHEEYEYLIK